MNKKIVIKEWETITLSYEEFIIENEKKLLQEVDEINNRGILEIELLRKEIRIASNSYVGEICVGDYLIVIEPKIKALDFVRMFNYTYNFSDLKLFAEVNLGSDICKIKDIFIYKLLILGRDLIVNPAKNYERVTEITGNLRGRINLREVVNNGGEIVPNISCTYFERIEDNLLNKIVFSMVVNLRKYTDSKELKRLCSNLKKDGEHSFSLININKQIIKKGLLSLNRLNQRYEEFLSLALRFLEGIHGSDMDSEASTINGFYIDMNKLFQDFIGKYIEDNLEGYTLKQEYSLNNMFKYHLNPLNKSNVYPRADFAICKGSKVEFILDAKYRDLWEKPLPREMLYQLSIYALSGVENKKARIIYPSSNKEAKLQSIEIRNVVTGEFSGWVELQPVDVGELLAGVRKKLYL